jgi:hypothetical protein
VNASDWVQATGHPIVGRGNSRPINPRYLATKAPAKMSAAFARSARQVLLRAARLTGEIDMLLPAVTAAGRRTVRDTSIFEQSRPSGAGQRAMLQHTRAVQLARR